MLEQTMTKEAVILKLSDLPPDGLAEVAASSTSYSSKPERSPVPRVTHAGEHPAFGIWVDRPEVQDPVQFTEHLRRSIETRQDG